MKKQLIISTLAAIPLVLSTVAASAKPQSKPDIQTCAARIKAECNISNNDVDRIESNGVVCKQVQGFNEKLEAVVLESGDVTVFQVSRGCKPTKFDLGGRTDIKDMKVIQGRAFLATDTGAIYYFRQTENGPVFREILKRDKTSYSGVESIKGTKGGSDIQFLDKNGAPLPIVDGQTKIGAEEIERLDDKNRLRTLHFVTEYTDRSLLRN